MSFYFSKSKFVSACTRCDKYAWLDKYKHDEKTPVSEFTESLFDNGHKVGELAKVYFQADADVSAWKDGKIDTRQMLLETKKQMELGTRVIAEASFEFGGLFCSVDILVKNDDGSYNIYEVKSSQIDSETYKKYDGAKERYVLDAAYQQYVLENCGINVNKVFVVGLNKTYVRGKDLELDKYFHPCDVTKHTSALQTMVRDKLAEIGAVLNSTVEPTVALFSGCDGCDYFAYCTKGMPSPSLFDVYGLNFSKKCELYNKGVSFFDAPKYINPKSAKLPVMDKQVKYYNRPNDLHVDKTKVKEFLGSLKFPLYSLDFETYTAVVPEFEGMKTNEMVPFQYSLHVLKRPDGDYRKGSADIEEYSFLEMRKVDPRRAIAESLVKNIPYGSCVIAYHKSTEKGIIAKLAKQFPDLATHLLSFTYEDPLDVFQKGNCYTASMGKSFSLKSVAPALYPDDPEMNYKNLEGDIKNGGQAMNALSNVEDLTAEELAKLKDDLEKYCALDTFALAKILKKLYEVSK